MAGPDLVGHRFDDVDRAPDPAKMVSYLDRATASAPIQRLKRTTYELLAATPGGAVLDVGCGMGDDVRALAEIVGPTGRVVGLDFSQTFIAEARARSQQGPGNTAFARGDSCRLPFADDTFDAVRSERMLQHLRDPGSAVREMARVVKPGGRVVDSDPDWDLMAIDAADVPTTRKIVHFRADLIANGLVGRRLSNLFRDAGLTEVTVVPMPTVNPSFAALNPMLELEAAAEKAAAAGVVTREEAGAWVADLKTRDASGRFFCGLTSYIVTGRKP